MKIYEEYLLLLFNTSLCETFQTNQTYFHEKSNYQCSENLNAAENSHCARKLVTIETSAP